MDYKILAFGDSIAYGFNDPDGGWVTHLRQDLDAVNAKTGYVHTAFNLGISGDKTADLLLRLEPETKARIGYKNDYRLVIAIGTNDAIQSTEDRTPEVTDEEFRKNYSQIIATAKTLISKTYVCSLPPVDERVWPMEWSPGRGYDNKRIDTFNAIIAELAKAADVPVIDLHAAFTEHDASKLLDDGLHPNTKGHQLIFRTIKTALDL
jgi:lysophospholipase L1-like esterase